MEYIFLWVVCGLFFPAFFVVKYFIRNDDFGKYDFKKIDDKDYEDFGDGEETYIHQPENGPKNKGTWNGKK